MNSRMVIMMRHVFLPNDLTALQLLEFQECPAIYAGIFQSEVLPLVRAGDYNTALNMLDIRVGDTQNTVLDLNTQVLLLLVKGEIYRRQGRWDDAVTHIRVALNILELQITSISKYNEGVAVYTEGLCHICTQAFDKVAATFGFAQDALTQSAAFWHYERIYQREYACEDVVQLMGQLHQAHRQVEPGVPAVFMPVYELRQQKFIRTDVLCLQAAQHALRIEHLPLAASSIIPLNVEGMSWSSLSLTTSYIAVRLNEGMATASLGNPSDVMIMEVPPDDVGFNKSQDTPGEEQHASLLQSFSKTHDGRIIYDAQMLRMPGCDWRVIPHLLIRREELL